MSPSHPTLQRRTHSLRLLALAVLLVTLGGCARGCTSRSPAIHLNPNMDDQPRYEAQAASAFFADGAAMQPPVEGTVARGELEYWENEPLYSGVSEDGEVAAEIPIAVTPEVMARGEERFGIYCGPCHGERADGRGMLRERSGVQTANLLEDRFRAYPVGQIYSVITHGVGLMSGYKHPIPPRDRWAIVAYVRQLQEAVGPMPAPGSIPAPGAAPATAAQPATAGEPAAADSASATGDVPAGAPGDTAAGTPEETAS